MAEIYDANGALMSSIPLSEKQQATLAADGAISVQFHTPQLLRNLIAIDAGRFELSMVGGKIVANDEAMFKRYLLMQDAIEKAQNA